MEGRRDACDPAIRLGRPGAAGVTILSRIESNATRHSERSEESLPRVILSAAKNPCTRHSERSEESLQRCEMFRYAQHDEMRQFWFKRQYYKCCIIMYKAEL